MTGVVLDASAVLALLRAEPGGEHVSDMLDDAIMSAVNLHEVAKELLVSGIPIAIVEIMLAKLRIDIRPHDSSAAFAAARLHAETKQYGRGLGDRACMSLAITLGVPALTADREWAKIRAKGLKIEMLR
ncbi:MAG: type II toxin-antitoxin system VapC family toxin [Pacificimonas sp.]